jgi:hypothetical protein
VVGGRLNFRRRYSITIITFGVGRLATFSSLQIGKSWLYGQGQWRQKLRLCDHFIRHGKLRKTLEGACSLSFGISMTGDQGENNPAKRFGEWWGNIGKRNRGRGETWGLKID